MAASTNQERVVIVGGGIAGLSAGCYARMNGFEVEIHESQQVAGGFCTSWERQGFTFDGCLHWLIGSSPGSMFNNYWQELGAIQGRVMLSHEAYSTYTGLDGRTVHWYCDAGRLERHLLELSPGDRQPIRQLCRLIRKFSRFTLPSDKPFSLMTKLDFGRMILKLLPYMRTFGEVSHQTTRQFAGLFEDSLLAESFRSLLMDDRGTLMGPVSTLGALHGKAAGFPQGGSLPFAQAIEKRFRELGGVLFLNSRVKRVMTQDGKASGIELTDGSHRSADWVILACDLQSSLDQLLEGRFASPAHRALLDPAMPKYGTFLQLFFGLNRNLTWEANSMMFNRPLKNPQKVPGCQSPRLIIKDYGFDGTLAPTGHSVVSALIPLDDPTAWLDLAKDPGWYRAAKQAVGEAWIDEIELVQPGFRAAIVTQDMVTPHTYHRYTRSMEGRFMSYVMTPENARQLQALPASIPGLEGLWLAGMWLATPGGVPAAAMTARNAVQYICHASGRSFRTNLPVLAENR